MRTVCEKGGLELSTMYPATLTVTVEDGTELSHSMTIDA
jgi:hypothetical protein